MATITTTEYLDSAARVAGEPMTISGGTLIIRTDTRWHANAPASMTGSLSNIVISSATGGKCEIDGTAVRWLAFNSGSGNVPAIGTSVTQGGVSGYLLGVYASLTSAPTAVGSAMPATGFIKFREVSGGNYSVGALSGISASATGPDVTGWIEVVLDASSTLSNGSMTSLFKSRGSWFYLDNTNGSRGQIFQVPTNGGGNGTFVPLFQVETAPGSNVFEWWTTVTVANGFTLTNLTTDVRSRVAEAMVNGQFRIGSDGTTNIGQLPQSGCRVRVPNIFARFCTTGARASNTNGAAATRPTSSFAGGGTLDFQHILCDWSILQAGLANNVTQILLQDSAFDTAIRFTVSGFGNSFANVAVGGGSQVQTSNAFTLNSVSSGVTIDGLCVFAAPSSGNIMSFGSCTGVDFNNIEIFQMRTRTSGSNIALNISGSTQITGTNLKLRGVGGQVINSAGVSISDIDYIDRLGGNTNSTQAAFTMRVELSSDVILNGFTFGMNGTISSVHPFSGLVRLSTNLGNIKIRNAGTKTSPLNCGTTSAVYPQYVVLVNGYHPEIKLQRLYLANVSTGIVTGLTQTQNSIIEHVYGGQSLNIQFQGPNSIYRANGTNAVTSSGSGQYGVHYADMFVSDTAGKLFFMGNSTSPLTESWVTLVTSGSLGSGFIGDGSLGLDAVGDYCIIEMQSFVIGHTGFQNVNPSISGANASTNFSVEYQIDTGSGWNGTWKSATGANLSAETVSPSVGFKMKIKITATVANTNNKFETFAIQTTSTAVAQENNLYVLDTVNLGFTGLQPGSEVRCYTGTDPATSVEIAGVESTSGSTFSFSHSSGGVEGYIMIFALGYQPIRIPYTYKTTDDSLLIQQVVDRNYSNPT